MPGTRRAPTLIRLKSTALCERHTAPLLSGEHQQLSVTVELPTGLAPRASVGSPDGSEG
ncbi:MAG: hypothetical protein AB1609_08535 [Bacillota bacterium]